MADERFKPDANFKAGGVVGGYNSSDSDSLIALRLDPTTKRLLVDVNGPSTGVTDGEVVDAADLGTLVLGTDGSNYQVLHTDSSGDLQVDVLSGGGGTQYTEDAAAAANPVGNAQILVRTDTPATQVTTDGEDRK